MNDISTQFDALALHHRPSQLDMIQAVTECFKQSHILCVEAPTGTGKTLAYLLGAQGLLEAKKKLIISTATIALQEQLIQSDLPLLERLVNKKFHYAIAKGRGNYVCLANLNDAVANPDLFEDDHYLEHVTQQTETPFWNGDREELSIKINDKQWSRITTTSSGCSGKQCEFYDNCYYFKARNKLFSADIVVTNHSLLLADIDLGMGVLLPDPKQSGYVIDEAHQLPLRALSHFAKQSGLTPAIDWLNQISSNISRGITHKFVSPDWQGKITSSSLGLIQPLKLLQQQLNANMMHFQEGIWRIVHEEEPILSTVREINKLARELHATLHQILTHLNRQIDVERQNPETADTTSDLSRYVTQFNFLMSRADAFCQTWEVFCATPGPKEAPTARWFEQKGDDFWVYASPINISQVLKTQYWDKLTQGALLCSATLKSLGQFDNFLRKTGLKQSEHLQTQQLPPIFDYSKSVLFIPSMRYEPSGSTQGLHRQEALDLIKALIIAHTGNLVLFTSISAMQETYGMLSENLKERVLMQGTLSRSQLLDTHKKRIDAGEGSILFGLASLAEGIDLPARYCQHVIIHKLPFAVPSDPIELTRSEWLTRHQLNPFTLATLPETAMRLTQYVGRLIRQEGDFGIVSILDRRLYTKAYAKGLINDLPPFARLINQPISALKAHPAARSLYASGSDFTQA